MPLAEVENQSEWILSSLMITHYSWDKEQPYQGKIIFKDRKENQLHFNIPPEKMAEMLALVSDCVVDSARQLGGRLAQSLPAAIARQSGAALPPSNIETIKEIGDGQPENTAEI